MKKFLACLILAFLAFSAHAAPGMTEDQLKRIAAIALESTPEQTSQKHPVAARAEVDPGSTISEKSEATRKEVTQWADMLSGIVVGTAQKVGVAVNEFVRTPVGLVVTSVIVYKAIGKDLIKLFFTISMWICACIVSIMFFRHRPRRVRTNVVYENIPVLFGMWNRRIVKSYDEVEDGDIGYIFLGAAAFLVGTCLSAIPIFG